MKKPNIPEKRFLAILPLLIFIEAAATVYFVIKKIVA